MTHGASTCVSGNARLAYQSTEQQHRNLLEGHTRHPTKTPRAEETGSLPVFTAGWVRLAVPSGSRSTQLGSVVRGVHGVHAAGAR